MTPSSSRSRPAETNTRESERTLFEIREDMEALVRSGKRDPEVAHSRADELLIEALWKMTALVGGDPTLWPREVEELIENWYRVQRWYA